MVVRDGGLLNEGANHLIHAAQRNDDITVLLHNNFVFALTTGQASSATPSTMATKSTPQGLDYPPLNPLLLAASSGAGFLARAFSFDLEKTTTIIKQAIEHRGFSLVEIIMPCLIWGNSSDPDSIKDKIFYPDNLPQVHSSVLDFLNRKENQLAMGVIWQGNK